MAPLSSGQLGEWVFNEIEKRAGNAYEKAKRLERISYLMEQGADPAWKTDMLADGITRSHTGYTLGMAAAYCLDADVIALLASRHVDMSAQDSHEMTPLLYVLQFAEDPHAAPAIDATVQALITAGADVTCGQPLITAAGGGLNATVSALIAAGADVNAQNSWGEVALVAAVAKQKIDTVKLLLASGANPEWVSKKTGKTLSEVANTFAKSSNDGVLIAQAIDAALAQRSKRAPKGPTP